MTSVPTAVPVTIPTEFTVATPVPPLVHVPPVDVSANVVDEPLHIVVVPVIGPTTGTTSSVIEMLPLFHLSPALVPEKLTAFTAAYNLMVPVPATGAVQPIDLT